MLGSSSTSTTMLSRYGWNSFGSVSMTRATICPNRRSDMRLMDSSCRHRPELSTTRLGCNKMRLCRRPNTDGERMTANIQEINHLVGELRAKLDPLYGELEKVIVGQRVMIDRLLVGLLTGGHILLEGVPGLAKTLAVRTLARGLRLSFHRIQFTPDLLPADVIGTQIYNPRTGEFSIKQGPIFANLVLADEINRAPAKVQSALLEAMQEKQVTIGDTSYVLEQPFLVLATQNPIEQEGTYPLPEAQVDRFMLKLRVDYPTKEEEREILDRMTGPDHFDVRRV